MLKAHRDKQLEEQSAALSEAQQCLQETLEAEVGGTGTRIKVKRLVTSLYSMYKKARADLAGRLTGIPLEDVPDSQVLELPLHASCIVWSLLSSAWRCLLSSGLFCVPSVDTVGPLIIVAVGHSSWVWDVFFWECQYRYSYFHTPATTTPSCQYRYSNCSAAMISSPMVRSERAHPPELGRRCGGSVNTHSGGVVLKSCSCLSGAGAAVRGAVQASSDNR